MCGDTEGNGRGWEGKHFQHQAEKKIGRQKELRSALGLVELSRQPWELQDKRLSGNIASLQEQPDLVSARSVVEILQLCL